MRPVELVEKLAARGAQAVGQPLLIETRQQIADCIVDVGETEEAAVAQGVREVTAR
jgi:hypothetical protein